MCISSAENLSAETEQQKMATWSSMVNDPIFETKSGSWSAMTVQDDETSTPLVFITLAAKDGRQCDFMLGNIGAETFCNPG
jgi:hypothetical protein